MSTNGTRLTSAQAWVLALTSAASLMVSLDTQVVATALPVIRLQLHASLAALEWTVNAYTLSFAVLLLTGAALGERLGRRRMLAAGVGLFTAASAGCALAPERRRPGRGPRRAGRGRGADAPAGACPAVRGVPAAAPGLGARDIHQRDRDRGAGRPGRRRRGRPGPGLAVDLLAERPDRAGHDPADPGQDPGGRTVSAPASIPAGCSWPPAAPSASSGPDPGQHPRLDQPGDRRHARGGDRARRGLHRLGTAGRRPHGAAAPVPLAAHRGGQRGHLQRVRPADGHGVLHGAVPGDRPGLRAARRRAAAAARLGHAGRDRAVRRDAHQPGGGAPADRRRPDRDRGRHGLDRG